MKVHHIFNKQAMISLQEIAEFQKLTYLLGGYICLKEI